MSYKCKAWRRPHHRHFRLIPVAFVADPFDTERATQLSAQPPLSPASSQPRANSRCDLAQYCPPPPPQFHETAPFANPVHSRGGARAPRTQPPMFADTPPMLQAHGLSHSPAHQSQPFMQQQIQRHQRILLFLRHCAKCTDPARCVYGTRCHSGKQLWTHIFQCSNQHCTYRNCVFSRELLRHYQKCVDKSCPICGPVRSYVASDQGTDGTSLPPF